MSSAVSDKKSGQISRSSYAVGLFLVLLQLAKEDLAKYKWVLILRHHQKPEINMNFMPTTRVRKLFSVLN